MKRTKYFRCQLPSFITHYQHLLTFNEHLQVSPESLNWNILSQGSLITYAPALRKSNFVAQQKGFKMLGFKLNASIIFKHFRTNLASFLVRFECLCFEYEDAVFVELPKHPLEHELDTFVAVIQMYPLCE